ncbi:uncharacterized protein [Argopecten irradians]|uniref:uncharacterized protein n=1 Tax=Argopecten irradians TaxID=31199 RepID=UPI0037139E67
MISHATNKMDPIIVISDDECTESEENDEEKPGRTSDTQTLDFERDMELAIRLSLMQRNNKPGSSSSASHSENPGSSSSEVQSEKPSNSKKASMHNRSWCKIRPKLKRMKQGSESPNQQICIEDSDELPDLNSDEECIYVKVFEGKINKDSDCKVVEEDMHNDSDCKVVDGEINNDSDCMIVDETDTESISGSNTVQPMSIEPTTSTFSSSNKPDGSKTSESTQAEEAKSSKSGRKIPFLSSEGCARLSRILKTVRHKNLQKSKSVEEKSKEENSPSCTPETWPFTIERHFSDILSGNSPKGRSDEKRSPETVQAPASPTLSVNIPSESFRPIKCSPILEHHGIEPQSAFSDYLPATSTPVTSRSPTPSKRLKLCRSIGAKPTEVKNPFEIVNMRLGKSVEFTIPKRRTLRLSGDTLTASSNPSDMRRFFEPIPSSSQDVTALTVNTLKNWQNNKPFNAEFPSKDSTEDSLSLKLSRMHVDAIGINFEEEGSYCLRQALKFTHDFSLKYIPTVDIVRQLLYKGIIENSELDLLFSSHRTLRWIQQRYPDTVQIDWDMLKQVMDSVNFGVGFVQQDVVVLLRTSLFLQLTVACYEDDLYNRDVVDPKGLRQSMAYKSLTFENSSYTGGVKQLTNWIVCCLTYGEFQEALDISSPFFHEQNQDIDQNQDVISRQEVGKILPLLQKLLRIAVEINRSCSDCARYCASELMKSFVYLSQGYKKLLLQTMESSLLQFKLLSMMLENHCDCDSFSYYEFPSSVGEVVENLLLAHPPRMMNTPPTTPQSEEEEGGGDRAGRFTAKVSSVALEELAMLEYYTVKSFLQCSKAKSHIPLRRRTRLPSKEFGSLSQESLKDIERLPCYIEKLREHYLKLAIDLTPDTEKYLWMMLCLKDVSVR